MTPTQLKAWVNNRAKETNIPADLLMRSYMLGKLVEKISESPYKENFIIKGGFLLGSVLGIENRATMDLDTTLQKMEVTEDKLNKMVSELIQKPSIEGIEFSLKNLAEIREADEYPGYRLSLIAKLGNMPIDLKVDITTGDSIYPHSMEYQHKLMFEDKMVDMYAYPLEQILAEKLHAAIYLEETNTRARDFYDIYMLSTTETIDQQQLEEAMRRTFDHRGMTDSLASYIDETGPILQNSEQLAKRWDAYSQSKKNPYAKNLTFDQVMSATMNTLNEVKAIEKEKQMEDELTLGD